MGGNGVKVRLKVEGIYVYLKLIHTFVWQKAPQHCGAVILQLKINFKRRSANSKAAKLIQIMNNYSQ